MNYLRNNDTGAQYNFESVPNQNALMGALDYTSGPVEIGGRKGYRLKSDGMTVMFDDGSKAMLGVDREATRKLQMGNLEMEKAELANKLLQAQITAAGQREGPTYQNVDTPNGIMAFNPKTGTMTPVMGANGQPMQSNKPLTEFQGKSTGFGMRAANSDGIIDSVGDNGNVQPSLLKRAADSVPLIGSGLGMIANQFQTPQQQQIEQAQRDFTNSVLRQESGAAIGKDEFDNARKQYFPQPGDAEEVIAQKKANRKLAIDGFKLSAGPGAKNIAAPSPSAASGPKIGAIESGHMYMGGDPASPASWKAVR